MRSVSVTELKANLARYLRAVRRGGEVEILERGLPIARLVALPGAREGDRARLERLAKAGILRRGSGDLSWLLASPTLSAPGADVSRALEEDREDRV